MNWRNRAVAILSVLLLLGVWSSFSSANVNAEPVEDTSFENGDLSAWQIGSQTGSLTNGVITQAGTGVSLITGTVAFSAPSHPGAGAPTLPSGAPNPYYQPPVTPATWAFSPYGSKAAALQPKGQATFDSASALLGLTTSNVQEIKQTLSAQAAASGYGSGTPTDAAWISKTVSLSAGTTYTMSWNYIGTDYVPFNDGSIATLVPADGNIGASVNVNNSNKPYALLGFTNPGTGDYSTGTFGSTGWQVSTYTVSQTGSYILGFVVFNLDDTGLSPVLLIDNQPGATTKNGQSFGAVAPNNPDAPTVPPTTVLPPTSSPATEPPVTSSPATEPPTTEPPVTEPPTTSPPATEPPVEESSTTTSTVPSQPTPIAQPIETTTTAPVLMPETTSTLPVSSLPADSPTIPSSQLPITGSNSDFSGLIAFGLLITGISLYAATRKKNHNA